MESPASAESTNESQQVGRDLSIFERLTQRKIPDADQKDRLKRCLSVFDLINSGISVMIGAGIFVITPVLTADTTGPAIIISYFIAGIASLFGALPYAELAARFMGIGSAYQYTYYVLGEFAASTIGISNLIEGMIGLAGIMKSLSMYVDALAFHGAINSWESVHFGLGVNYMADYVDIFALLLLILCGVLNLSGVKQTVVVSAVCNIVVVVTLLLIGTVGISKGSIENWNNVSDPDDHTKSGFAPYGIKGILTGASLAYFSYNGFDCIASLGCEAKRPNRDMPVGIIASFGAVMTLYIFVCAGIISIAPFYTLSENAAMANAFKATPWMTIVVSLGAVLATATGSFSGLMVTSRIMYSMGEDGILFRSLTAVNKLTKVPWVSIVVSMILPALGIMLLDIEELVQMNSGGLLICFCLTNMCVIVGRYQEPRTSMDDIETTATERNSIVLSLIFWGLSILSWVAIHELGISAAGIITFVSISVLGFFTIFIIQFKLVETKQINTTFRCPFSPWIPAIGIYINNGLMVALPLMTWIRVLVCLFIGQLCYFLYGLKHSNLTLQKQSNSEASEYIRLTDHFTADSDTDQLIS